MINQLFPKNEFLFFNIKIFINENEIFLSIQLPSNNTYVLVLTFSSPDLFMLSDYTFNAHGKKITNEVNYD